MRFTPTQLYRRTGTYVRPEKETAAFHCGANCARGSRVADCGRCGWQGGEAMRTLDGVSTVKRRNRRVLRDLRCTTCDGVGVVRLADKLVLCQPCNGKGSAAASVRTPLEVQQ